MKEDSPSNCKTAIATIMLTADGKAFHFTACGRSVTVLTPELLFDYGNCTRICALVTRDGKRMDEITLIRDTSDPCSTVEGNHGFFKPLRGDDYELGDKVEFSFLDAREGEHVDIEHRFDLYAAGDVLTSADFPRHHSSW